MWLWYGGVMAVRCNVVCGVVVYVTSHWYGIAKVWRCDTERLYKWYCGVVVV